MTTVSTTQQQDIDFINEFVVKFAALITSLAIQHKTNKDEIINILYTVVLGDKKFDPAKGNRFSRTCFMLQHEVRNSFGYDYSVFDSIEIDQLEDVEAAEIQSEFENWRTDNTLKNKHIGGHLEVIVKLVLDGYSFEQCAKKMGLTVRRIEQIAAQAHKTTVQNIQQDLFAA